eukprot:TRINITY_DN14072_c4_g1_i1.p1 TRINITY_DN14072_c4_g1~~TRINITY_DN14072_c4_g1_i1.p1  ORF type:complete len:141 (-),score=2.16 TRINITY_DN14072_c4_g1_i1:293-658(-)
MDGGKKLVFFFHFSFSHLTELSSLCHFSTIRRNKKVGEGGHYSLLFSLCVKTALPLQQRSKKCDKVDAYYSHIFFSPFLFHFLPSFSFFFFFPLSKYAFFVPPLPFPAPRKDQNKKVFFQK